MRRELCDAPDDQPLAVEAALDIMRADASLVVNSSIIALDECHGRYLAAPLRAGFNVPDYDSVAVDGWALRYAADMGRRLPIQEGRSAAGHPFEGELQPGYGLRVLTGAVMPRGADTVILQEECEVESSRLHLPEKIKAGSNLRPRGEDIRAGEVVFNAGHRLRAQDLGVAALMQRSGLDVFEPVKVAVASTGDEVREGGETNSAGAVFDANRPMLKALLSRLPVAVTDLGRLKDERESVVDAMAKAAATHHAVITTGGVSKGDEDHVAAALMALGERRFSRLALKPGRPMTHATIGKCHMLGLPGNPVAAFVCFQIFALPLLAILGGGTEAAPLCFPVELRRGIRKAAGRTEWVRGRLIRQDGGLYAEAVAKQGSGMLTSLAEAGGILALPAELANPKQGDRVPFIPFENGVIV